MAAEGGVTKRLRVLNIVHNDEIWKDHVRHELVSARQKWPDTWGYLVHEYRKLNRALEGLPYASRPGTSNMNNTLPGLKLPEIPQRRQSFPRTTSREVGWKSIQNGLNSEMVTRYAEERRGRCTIYRKLKWPTI